MITSITADNEKVYEALFNEATHLLKLPKKIETLEEYFGKIAELKEKNLKFTKLPIMNEQDYFNIDANTRTISIPSSFRTNGLGVQGDMGAETVYFRINRYYDAIDLGRTVIWIQWETDTHKGITTEYLRDIESEQDYLIFGWTIGKLMTQSKGNITFSVRFLDGEMEDEEKGTFKTIRYSFGTKPAVAIINPTINADPTLSGFEMDNSANADLYNSIINTTTSTDNKISIFEIVKDLDALAANESDVDRENMIVYLNLKIDDDISSLEEGGEGENGESSDTTEPYKFTFETQAYSYPGEVFYYLCYQEKEKQNLHNDPRVKMDIIYKVTEDKTVQQYKDYYLLNSDLRGYNAASTVEIGDTIPPNTLYERVGQFTLRTKAINQTFKRPGQDVWFNSVDINGKFYAIALVRISESASSPRATEYTATFPGPETPSVTYDTNEKYYIPSSEEEAQTLTPTIDYKGATPVSYQWYKKGYEDESYQEITAESTSESGATGPSLTISSESPQAYYALQVTSKRNGTPTSNQPEGGFYVTKKLELNDYTIKGEPDYVLYASEPGEEKLTIKVEPASGMQIIGEPQINYVWNRFTDMGGQNTELVTAEWCNDATVTRDQFETYWPGGVYRCDVTVTYNGISIILKTGRCGVVSGHRPISPSSTP